MHQRIISYFILISAIATLLALPTQAIEFPSLGFEAASMGGAGVASANGSFAPYYNPALLPEHSNGFEMSVSTGVGIREVNVVDHIDNLAEIGIEDTFSQVEDEAFADPCIDWSSGTLTFYAGLDPNVREDIRAIKHELDSIANDMNGIQIMPSLTVAMQVWNLGFGVYGISEATAYGIIDPERTDFIVEDSGVYVRYDPNTDQLILTDPNDYRNNSLQYAVEGDPNDPDVNPTTYLKLAGLAYMEIPISYGHKFITSDWGDINVGASFKLMPGYTYDHEIKLDTESGDLEDQMEDAQKSDMSWGIDLGVLYKPVVLPNLTIGLAAKNINTPKFETATGGHFEVKPQIRAGFAYKLWENRITMALDMDLTKNETFIPDYDSQYIGGGINFHPLSWFSLRAGAMSNIQESIEGTVLTGGLSLGIKWLQIDVAGQYSMKEGEFDGSKIPRYSKVQVALVSKWF
ncbi:MAG: conjugal transfer protein TraF [bacterium]